MESTIVGKGTLVSRKETLKLSRAFPKGFTLIELLVVVSIIALLVSILLPALSKAREQAKHVKCMVHVRGVGVALMMYGQDNNDYYPTGSEITPEGHDFGWSGYNSAYWVCTVGVGGVRIFAEYVSLEPDIVFCPSNKTWINYYYDDWNTDTSTGNTSYFPYCGRNAYYPNSPMKLSDPGSWYLWGDITSSNQGEVYNNHGVENGANWAYVDGHVEYVEREHLVERFSNAYVTYLAPEN